MGKHHGSEGRKSVKIATKNSLISKLRNGASATLKQQGPEGRKSIKIADQKLPNVISETHRKGRYCLM